MKDYHDFRRLSDAELVREARDCSLRHIGYSERDDAIEEMQALLRVFAERCTAATGIDSAKRRDCEAGSTPEGQEPGPRSGVAQ